MTQIIATLAPPPWLPEGSSLCLFDALGVPPQEKVTSVHALCFVGKKLLMVKHQERSWDIPGGHVEKGESLEKALERELFEEAAVLAGTRRPLAYLHIQVPDSTGNYPYPKPDSFMVCYLVELGEILEFQGKFETSGRAFFTPEEVRTLAWYVENSKLYEFGLGRRIDQQKPS